MVFGMTPWYARDERSLLANILKNPYNKYNPYISAFSNEFLRRSLEIDEKKRMSWDELFELLHN